MELLSIGRRRVRPGRRRRIWHRSISVRQANRPKKRNVADGSSFQWGPPPAKGFALWAGHPFENEKSGWMVDGEIIDSALSSPHDGDGKAKCCQYLCFSSSTGRPGESVLVPDCGRNRMRRNRKKRTEESASAAVDDLDHWQCIGLCRQRPRQKKSGRKERKIYSEGADSVSRWMVFDLSVGDVRPVIRSVESHESGQSADTRLKVSVSCGGSDVVGRLVRSAIRGSKSLQGSMVQAAEQ
jgi:hypothetical protein